MPEGFKGQLVTALTPDSFRLINVLDPDFGSDEDDTVLAGFGVEARAVLAVEIEAVALFLDANAVFVFGAVSDPLTYVLVVSDFITDSAGLSSRLCSR